MRGKRALISALCVFASLAAGSLADDSFTPAGRPGVRTAPLLLWGDRVFTRVSVNGGEDRLFLIDNGWSRTTLDTKLIDGESFAANATVSFDALHMSARHGVEGRIAKMSLGELEIPSPEVRTADVFCYLSRRLNRKVHGILGCSTIRRYLTTFDFKSKRICFVESSPEILRAIEQHPDAVALQFGPYPLGAANSHVFSVSISINGNVVDAFLDIGFPGGILTTVDYRELGLFVDFNQNRIETLVMGLRGQSYTARAKVVSIGGHARRDVSVLYMMHPGAPAITIVGLEILRHFTLTMDYANRKVYLAPCSGKGACDYYLP